MNPWTRLRPKPPFVLPEDAHAASDHELRLPPGPWYGPLNTAPVVALMLSPGVNSADFLDVQDPKFLATSLAQLTGDSPFPFHLPRWSHTAAGQYWAPRLRDLADATTDELVAERFAVAQLLPYHSKSWQEPRGIVPSQSFTFELVRRAIARHAVLIALVGWSRWTAVMPELERADVVVGRNPRNPYISPGNLGSAYWQIIRRLLA
jgi:hypothetical protein